VRPQTRRKSPWLQAGSHLGDPLFTIDESSVNGEPHEEHVDRLARTNPEPLTLVKAITAQQTLVTGFTRSSKGGVVTELSAFGSVLNDHSLYTSMACVPLFDKR
jgi:hypothetical protein